MTPAEQATIERKIAERFRELTARKHALGRHAAAEPADRCGEDAERHARELTGEP